MFLLLVITPEKDHPKEIEIITSLFENGLKTLHVRKPDFTEDELRAYLQEIPKKFYKKIVIHSHYKLSSEFNLKGVHLTEKNRKQKIRNVKVTSASFHSMVEILKSRRKYEYIFLSPIFNSISKQGYKSNFDLDELESFLKRKKNVIALSGINTKNIEIVKQMSFAGAALLGAIWEDKKPLVVYQELVSKIE